MKKSFLIFVSFCLILSTITSYVSASDSNQIYIENSEAGPVEMTASLYGYTSDGTYIRIGSAIVRSDYTMNYTPTYSVVDLRVRLYKNHSSPMEGGSYGTMIASCNNNDVAVGESISTDDVIMNSSANAQNLYGIYSMETPDGLTVHARLSIFLESDGTLSEDTDERITFISE